MCSCEPGFVCSRCKGTPDDPRYHEAHEPEPRRLSWSDYPNGVQELPAGFEPPEAYLG